MFIIENNLNFIRGWQGHKIESEIIYTLKSNRREKTPLGLNKLQKLRQISANLLLSSIIFINLLQQRKVFNGPDPAT